jgi:hypothetical protein
MVKHKKDENQTVVTGNPSCSTMMPPSVGPAKDPQKNDDAHIPEIIISFLSARFAIKKFLKHRYLNGGPRAQKGPAVRANGVHKDHKSKVLYHFKPLSHEFRGPPIDTLRVRGLFFDL